MKWPSDTREGQKQHAFRHVKILEYSLGKCKRFRTAIQAGGNVGLWPLRMAEIFERVITFEPEPITLACLMENINSKNVEIRTEALGAKSGRCSIERRSLGSHRVVPGDDVQIIAIDDFGFTDVDFIQLDIEGYELQALYGAEKTIQISNPLIHLELRNFTQDYGGDDEEVSKFLINLGYRAVGFLNCDVVFEHD